MTHIDAMRLSADLERALYGTYDGSLETSETYPWLSFPEPYAFKPVFPFRGAAVRFYVCRKDNPTDTISIYLDVANVLGIVGQPYWEAYAIEGDTARFLLHEADEMIQAVTAELDRRKEAA